MRYSVKPISYKYQRKAEIAISIICNSRLSFWDFLLLNFRVQLDLIAYKYLRQRRGIIETSEKIESGIDCLEISDRDIFELCQNSVKSYYRLNRKLPAYIFIGGKQMQSLASHEFCREIYFRYPDCDIYGYLSHNLGGVQVVVSPYMDGVFCWSGEGLKLKE